MNILYKILNEALLQWDDSDVEDTGLIKTSDVKNSMRPQLIYKIDKQKSIKIFDNNSFIYKEYKDKVYINDEHIQLEDGWTVNEYEPGEYRVYIEDFDKLEDLWGWAFWGCTSLTSITIPGSVTEVGASAFRGCTGLTSITIPDSVTSIGGAAFSYCIGLTSVNIGNSVTSIGGAAFSDCIGLTSITIPDSVTSIGSAAFSGCSGLTSVTIGNSVTWISEGAFEYCSSLISIIIPNSVTRIGEDAFRDCTSLTSVTIPDSVTKIEDSVFYDCKELKKVYVENIDKFNKIYFKSNSSNPTYYGAELIELKKGLNEALLQWDDSDTEDDSYILNQHSIKRSLEGRIDLNDYKKSVAYWQNENHNYPWFKNYINDIINLYFNNKQDFEKYIKTCINDSNGFDRDKDQAIYYSVTNNYGLFIDKLFRMPDESELKAIVDITKYIPLKYQSTFWTIAIFGDKGLIWCIVKHNEI